MYGEGGSAPIELTAANPALNERGYSKPYAVRRFPQIANQSASDNPKISHPGTAKIKETLHVCSVFA